MKNSIYWLAAVIVFSIVCISCKDLPKKNNVDDSKMFPPPNSKLKSENLEKINFKWKSKKTISSEKNLMKFKLYEVIPSGEFINGNPIFDYKLVEENIVEEGNSYTFDNKDKTKIIQNRNYAWEVTNLNTESEYAQVQDVAYFTTREEEPRDLKDCYIVVKDSACNIIREIPIGCPPNTHIATFEKFADFNGGNLRVASPGINNSSNCFKSIEDTISIFAVFEIKVPCDSVLAGAVNPSFIEAFLFENQDLIEDDGILTEKRFFLNPIETAPYFESDSTTLMLENNHFKRHCENNVQVCKAIVVLRLKFNIPNNPQLDPNRFNIVFYLNQEVDHAHSIDGRVIINEELIEKVSLNHNHSKTQLRLVPGTTNCSLFNDKTKLKYYSCRDELKDSEGEALHIAKHISIVEIPLCN